MIYEGYKYDLWFIWPKVQTPNFILEHPEYGFNYTVSAMQGVLTEEMCLMYPEQYIRYIYYVKTITIEKVRKYTTEYFLNPNSFLINIALSIDDIINNLDLFNQPLPATIFIKSNWTTTHIRKYSSIIDVDFNWLSRNKNLVKSLTLDELHEFPWEFNILSYYADYKLVLATPEYDWTYEKVVTNVTFKEYMEHFPHVNVKYFSASKKLHWRDIVYFQHLNFDYAEISESHGGVKK